MKKKIIIAIFITLVFFTGIILFFKLTACHNCCDNNPFSTCPTTFDSQKLTGQVPFEIQLIKNDEITSVSYPQIKYFDIAGMEIVFESDNNKTYDELKILYEGKELLKAGYLPLPRPSSSLWVPEGYDSAFYITYEDFSKATINLRSLNDNWITLDLIESLGELTPLQKIFKNDNYTYLQDRDRSNAIAFIIFNNKTNEQFNLMSHDGDNYEVTQDKNYFIQYREHITSNIYQSATFVSVYDLNTAKLIKRAISSDLNLKLSRNEWFSIYIDADKKEPLNFYNEDSRSLSIPIKQCLNGPENECKELDPFVLQID